jgi:hypothetical protein
MGRFRSLPKAFATHWTSRYVVVVPVLPATRDLWTHDPFGGEYDGTYIWGRGSSDDKSGLIGIMYVPSQLPKIEELMTGPRSNSYWKKEHSNPPEASS